MTLVGLTSGSTAIAVLGFLATSLSAAAARYGSEHHSFDAGGHMQWGGYRNHAVSSTIDVVVTLTADAGTFSRSGDTLFARYYVLKEVSV